MQHRLLSNRRSPRCFRASLAVAASGTAEPGDGLELWSPIIAPSRALDEIGEALVVLDEPAEGAAGRRRPEGA